MSAQKEDLSRGGLYRKDGTLKQKDVPVYWQLVDFIKSYPNAFVTHTRDRSGVVRWQAIRPGGFAEDYRIMGASEASVQRLIDEQVLRRGETLRDRWYLGEGSPMERK